MARVFVFLCFSLPKKKNKLKKFKDANITYQEIFKIIFLF